MIVRDEAVSVEIHGHKNIWRQHRGFDVVDASLTLSPLRGPSRLAYEVTRIGRVAAILPYDPASDQLILLRQFRIGAHLGHGFGANIEIVAGRLEPGEDMIAAAWRETKEETGLVPHTLRRLFDFAPAPAASDEFATVFLALVDADDRVPIAGLAEEGETILPFAISPHEAKQALLSGQLRNGYTALSWFFMMGGGAS